MGDDFELCLNIPYPVFQLLQPSALSPSAPPLQVLPSLFPRCPFLFSQTSRCPCSSSALSTSSCGPETVGLCSRRPRGTGRPRPRARLPARRAQLSREQWRSSRQPPARLLRNRTSPLNHLRLPGLPSPSSSTSPPPPFWAWSFEKSSSTDRWTGQAAAVRNLGSPHSGFLSFLLLEPQMGWQELRASCLLPGPRHLTWGCRPPPSLCCG